MACRWLTLSYGKVSHKFQGLLIECDSIQASVVFPFDVNKLGSLIRLDLHNDFSILDCCRTLSGHCRLLSSNTGTLGRAEPQRPLPRDHEHFRSDLSSG